MNRDFYVDPEHEAFAFAAGPRRALLIHGFLGSPRELRPLGQALAEAGITVAAPLLPGFGPEIDRLRHTRYDEWLAAAREAWITTRSGAERATLIGFSMGGAVALRLASELGLAVDQLVLLAPHWKYADQRTRILPVGKYVIRDFAPYSLSSFERPEIRSIFAELAPGADLDDRATRRRLQRETSIPTAALDELRRLGYLAARGAPRVTAPTLIFQGAQDPTTLPRHSRTLARRMGAELREVPGDHLIVDPSRPSWPEVRDNIIALARGDGQD